VRQRSGATLSAQTVGESLCMSKSVEAHYKGQIVSARNLPTGCQQQCSLVVPTVRAPRYLTEPGAKVTSEAADDMDTLIEPNRSASRGLFALAAVRTTTDLRLHGVAGHRLGNCE